MLTTNTFAYVFICHPCQFMMAGRSRKTLPWMYYWLVYVVFRRGSRAAATSKMERFVIKVNGFQPLTIITKRSILDVAAALDPPLVLIISSNICSYFTFFMQKISHFINSQTRHVFPFNKCLSTWNIFQFAF